MEVCVNFLQLQYIVVYCVSTAISTVLQLYSLFFVVARKNLNSNMGELLPSWHASGFMSYKLWYTYQSWYTASGLMLFK